MGKLLRILTIFIFIFSVAAIILGTMNFNKRELLIGRTHELEQAVMKLGNYILTGLPEKTEVGEGTYKAWDCDEVTDRPNDDPNMDDSEEFWKNYENQYEDDDGAEEKAFAPTFNLKAKQEQLATYFKYGMVDGKRVVLKDNLGRPIHEGEGTMNALLKQTIDAAEAQLTFLNNARAELTKVRKELESVAEMLNNEKKQRRENLATITQLNAKIDELNGIIAQKDTEIARLNREKDELNDQINSLNETIAQKDQELADFAHQVEMLKAEIERLRAENVRIGERPNGLASNADVALAPGVKGKVISVNPQWSFVVIELTPETVEEIKPKEDGVFLPVEMMVNRKGPDGEDIIVTRVRITNPPNKDRHVVADNMYGWEQVPVEAGDAVVY